MTPPTLRIIFMGTSEEAGDILEKMIESGWTPMAIVTQPDKPKGRGMRVAPPPVKEVAQRHHLEVFQPTTWKSEESITWLSQQSPDVVFIVAYGKILPPEVLPVPRFGCFNLHASLLPQYRGPNPIRSAILEGESETGVSIFQLDSGVDTGPFVLQEAVPISDSDDYGTLSQKLFSKGAELLPKFFSQLERGELHLTSQGGMRASDAPVFQTKEYEIDWRKPAEHVGRQIRALAPYPGAHTRWNNKRLKVLRATVRTAEKVGSVGEVLALDPHQGIGARAAMGILWIQELQLEGGSRMSAADFLKGHPLHVGDRFG